MQHTEIELFNVGPIIFVHKFVQFDYLGQSLLKIALVLLKEVFRSVQDLFVTFKILLILSEYLHD